MSGEAKGLLVFTGLVFGLLGVALLCAYVSVTSGWPVIFVFPIGTCALLWAGYFGMKWASR